MDMSKGEASMKRTSKGYVAMAAAIGVMLGLGASARAGIIYSQTFDGETSDMLTYYSFTSVQDELSTGGYSVTAGGPVSWVGDGGGYMTTVQTLGYEYDWSQPLTLSANLGTTVTSGGTSYGLVLGSASAGVGITLRFDEFAAGKGVMYMSGKYDAATRLYVETTPYPPIDSSGDDVVALTIRQNGDETSKFDVKMELNGVAYSANTGGWWALPGGIAAVDGWLTGVNKTDYGMAASGSMTFENIGFRADGLNGTQTLDNLTLTLIPEPATFGMMGAAAVAMLLRRRFAR
jgi:hypothetical protein